VSEEAERSRNSSRDHPDGGSVPVSSRRQEGNFHDGWPDDELVNVDDLVNVILDRGTDGSANGGDVNDDGIVNVDDLLDVILGWGPCP
jgi:hypothetical protein